jgi:hypothetical protein
MLKGNKMNDINIFDKYPLGEEFYNPDRFGIERVEAHIAGKWLTSNSDWYGIISVPVLPDIKYYKRKHNHYSLWGKYGYNNSNKNDGKNILIAGNWPESYFVYCINGTYGLREILFINELKLDTIGSNLQMIRSKISNQALLVYGYESNSIDDYGFELAYSISLARQYLNAEDGYYKNKVNDKEFVKVARYLVYKLESVEEDNIE